ncbi:MAG: class I SAM-dependent methyltransferase [Mycoplasmatales bacterium]
MKSLNLINFVKQHINLFGQENTVIIDATCGNGNDTELLSKEYPSSLVYSFDIQQVALDKAKVRCSNTNINYILDSHSNIKDYVQSNVSLVVFNLGYLPNEDRTITTQFNSTKLAIESSLDILNYEGGIIITLYRGEENIDETNSLLEYFSTINKDKYIVSSYQHINLKDNPLVIIIEKKFKEQ